MQGLPGRSATHSPSAQFTDPNLRAVAEAIQVLEHSALLMRSPGDRAHVGLTRLGMHALSTSSVRQHLGLADAPPS
jgi:hypothetical protein